MRGRPPRSPTSPRWSKAGAAVALVVGSGCTHPEYGTREVDPSPWVYTADEQPDAVEPAVMQEEVQELLDHVRDFNGWPVIRAYEAARTHGNELCPEEVTTESVNNGTTVYFERVCVVDDVYWFKGPLTTYAFENNALDNFDVYDIFPYLLFDGTLWTGQAMKGQADIYSDDASRSVDYNCSCTAFAGVSAPSAEKVGYFSYVDGPTHLVAPEAEDTWFNQGYQSHLFLRMTVHRDDPRWQAEVVGSVTGYGEVYGDVEMNLLVQGYGAPGGDITCVEGGGGTITARHTVTGRRTEMTLITEGSSCRACADVEGEDVCVDYATLMNWGAAPW